MENLPKRRCDLLFLSKGHPEMTTPNPAAEALAPCPLCGCQPIRNPRWGRGGVRCASGTHFLQTYGENQEQADAAWNTRPTVALDREAVAKLLDETFRKGRKGDDPTIWHTAADAILALKGSKHG